MRSIEIDTSKGEGLDKIYSDIMDAVNDMNFQYILTEQLNVLAGMHEYYFSMEIDPNGQAWEKLADYTIFKKGHDTILVESGELKASLTGGGTPNSYREVMAGVGDTKAVLLFGTDVEYAHWHMTGTSKMPARPMVGVTDQYVDRLAQDVADIVIANLMK